MPKFKNKDEKRAFLNNYRDIYALLGYDTPEAIDQVIEEQVEAQIVSDETYERAEYRTGVIHSTFDTLSTEKYTGFRGSYIDSTFARVIRAMYKPETSVENIEYNEMISRKLRSNTGAAELLQDAVTLLSQVTPDVIKAAKTDNDVFMENYNAIMAGFVIVNLTNIVSNLSKNHEYAAMFPKEMVNFLEANKNFFEDFKDIDVESKLYQNDYHYVIPQDTSVDAITNCFVHSVGKRKDSQKIVDLNSQRSALVTQPKPYTPPSESLKGHFAKIQERMNRESRDYTAAKKHAEHIGARSNILRYSKAFDTIALTLPAKDEKLIAIAKSNRELLADTKESVLDQAKANFDKSFKDAADEMAKVLEDGNILGHTNANYKAMMTSMEAIRQIARQGKMSELSKEDKLRLSEELKKLDKASADYLTIKYTDQKVFSDKAMLRIKAARMCSAFVTGRMNELVMEQNKDLKAELAARVFTPKDARESLDKATLDYERNHTLTSFVKRLTYSDMLRTSQTMPQEQANAIVSQKIKAYRMLYNGDENFKNAVNSGDFKAAREAINPAVKALQQKAGKQAPEKAAAEKTAAEKNLQDKAAQQSGKQTGAEMTFTM